MIRLGAGRRENEKMGRGEDEKTRRREEEKMGRGEMNKIVTLLYCQIVGMGRRRG
ncbi:MAG: hypothetical protein KGY70_05165 [Bacteroidales bacterium]|nr:hypothetical protein [Bacteroidales bacterium]